MTSGPPPEQPNDPQQPQYPQQPHYPQQWAPPPPPPFEIGDAFAWSWRQFRRNQTVFVLGALPALVLTTALYAYYIAEFILGDSFPSGSAVSTDELLDYYQRLGVFTLASFALTLPLAVVAANMMRAAFIVADGGTPTIGTLFSLRGAGRVLATVLVVGVLMTIGLVLCVLPGLAFAVFTAFTMSFVVDRNLGPFAAIRASFSLVGANLGLTLLTIVTVAGVAYAGTVALLVGVLISIPIAVLAQAYAFRRLTGGVVTEP